MKPSARGDFWTNSTPYYKEISPICDYYSGVVLYLHRVIGQVSLELSHPNLCDKAWYLGKKQTCSLRALTVFEFLLQNCWNPEQIPLLPEALHSHHLHPHSSYLVACFYKKWMKCWKWKLHEDKKRIDKYSLGIWNIQGIVIAALCDPRKKNMWLELEIKIKCHVRRWSRVTPASHSLFKMITKYLLWNKGNAM